MHMYDIILKKREGKVLTREEIQYFVEGYTHENIPDYQISALLMAIYFRKMNREETLYLTEAMMNSGDTLDLSKIEGIKVDKHSTGGVGDTTTLILGPMVAALGAPVAKMSGRGLGHTGGTIDKLESFYGLRTDLSEKEFIENVNRIKFALASQTGDLAPADKRIYALRDVTATVDNLSLIASSIMSKKLASGADAIVLDVKTGSGALMKKLEDSIELAKVMVDIGNGMDKETIAVISNMDQPLGRAVGNALEVKEAIETLQGKGPEDLYELCLVLGSQMLLLARVVESEKEAREKLEKVIQKGLALEKLKEFVKVQGGDPKVVDQPELLPKAKYTLEVLSPKEGFIKHIQADEIGKSTLLLGAGRKTKDSKIDLSAGVYLSKKVGDFVKKGEILAILYSNDSDRITEAQKRLTSAYSFSEEKGEPLKLIYGLVSKDRIKYL